MTTTQGSTLRSALGEHTSGRGKRYDAELKSRVVAFAQAQRGEGRSWAQVATELGLRFETLRRWCVKGSSSSLRAMRLEAILRIGGVSIVPRARRSLRDRVRIGRGPDDRSATVMGDRLQAGRAHDDEPKVYDPWRYFFWKPPTSGSSAMPAERQARRSAGSGPAYPLGAQGTRRPFSRTARRHVSTASKDARAARRSCRSRFASRSSSARR
jgi:transposase-like protein